MGCSIYDGEAFTQLFKSGLCLPYRNQITTLSETEIRKIKTADTKTKTKIKYTKQMRSSTVTLNVPFVQQTASEICWAASVAMIVNYKKNLNYQAWYIAYMQHGSNYNQGLNPSRVDDFLNDFFSLNYYYHGSSASLGTICTNINNSNPIYGSFYYSYGDKNYHHGSVIYGYNLVNNTIFIKDPQIGSVGGQMSNGVLCYYASSVGVTLFLQSTVCKNW